MVSQLAVFPARRLKKEVTFSIVTCGKSSHVVTPYFQCRPPDISSLDSLRSVVCVSACVFVTAVWTEKPHREVNIVLCGTDSS